MEERSFKVLLVEDDQDDVVITRKLLSRAEPSRYELDWAASYDEGLERVLQGNYDVCLLDYRLKEHNGLELLREAVGCGSHTPFILLTGDGSREVDVEAAAAGAADYMVKGEITTPLIERSIRYAIERQCVEEELKKSERRFRALLESTPDAIVITKSEGTIYLVNAQAEKLFGYDREELLGQKVDLIMPARFPGQSPEYPSGSEGHTLVREMGAATDLFALRKDGSEFPVEVSRSPIETETGMLVAIDVRDVTERKKAQEELDKSRRQQLEIKDQFISHVSHELRSPLAVIHQFVTLMLDGLLGEISAEQRENLDIVLKNTLQLREMISDLLDITRAESGKLLFEQHPLSILQIFIELERNYRQTAMQKGILFLVQEPRDLGRIYADPQRLRQILSNLIDNAFKFTERGKISIRASVDNDPSFIRIAVSDTGCGISPQGISRVFDRLYQEQAHGEFSRNGLGLGLHICEQLVLLHGGRIWVESKQQQGSTFFFTIPKFNQNYSEKEF